MAYLSALSETAGLEAAMIAMRSPGLTERRTMLKASRRQLQAVIHAARMWREMIADAEARGDQLMRVLYPENRADLNADVARLRAYQHRLMKAINGAR